MFTANYLTPNFLNRIQSTVFLVKGSNFLQIINPDIAGSMTQTIFDSSKIVGPPDLASNKDNSKGSDLLGASSFRQEGFTILLSFLKFYGRDVNVMELYYGYKKLWEKEKEIITKSKSAKKNPNSDEAQIMKLKERDVQGLFRYALGGLKYMGYVSQTRQSPFLFKRNYFGKVRHLQLLEKTEDQRENDRKKLREQGYL